MLSSLYWLIIASLFSPALFARLIAYSQTSAASLCASCLRQATAARRRSRWELDRWTCKPQKSRGNWCQYQDITGVHLVVRLMWLTQRHGTRLDRFTWRGANICNCCKHEMAAACTRESEWSCIMAQPTRQDERIVEIVAPFPTKQKCKLFCYNSK